MPIVPQFNREDLPQIMPTGPQADPGQAAVVGNALQRFGQSGVTLSADAADYLRQHMAQENYDYNATNIAGARTKWTDEYLKRSAAAQQSGNYTGFASQMSSDMTADLQQRIAGAPSPRAADALKKTFANLQDEFTTKASLFEGDGKEAVWTGDTSTNLKQILVNAYRDPTQADSVYAEGLGIIHGGVAAGLNQGNLDKMGETWKNQVYGAAVQHGIEGERPQDTLAALNAGHFDKMLSEPQLVEFQGQANAAVKRQQAEARAQANENAIMARGSVDSAFQDNLASITDTGKPAVPLSRAQIAAAYPRDPARVDAMMAGMSQAQTGYVARQHVALNSPADDAALLTQLKPSGPGYADQRDTFGAVAKAVQAKNQALSDDPAAYVQKTSPQVRGLFQAATQDPTMLPKAMAAQDAVYDHLGVPQDQRPVLSQPAAAAIVSKINGTDPSKTDVGAALTQMAQSYGSAWPRVYQDLVAAKLPPNYEVLATMDTPQQLGGRQDMQRALAISAQKGGPRAIEETTPADASTAIKTGLPDMLSEFRQTAVIPGASANVGLLAKVGDSISLLAHTYALQGQDGSTALKNAYDAVIGDKYDFDGSMRVPKGTLPQVHAATDQALASIQPQELRASAGLPADVAADRWTSAKQNSAWYPTQAGDGLQLMVQTRDGRWNRVQRADGAPVQVLFKDIGNAAPGAPLPSADPGAQQAGP